ncbi:calcitonin gene-related peptide type 1 receptor [Aplochiton taeniatus]
MWSGILLSLLVTLGTQVARYGCTGEDVSAMVLSAAEVDVEEPSVHVSTVVGRSRSQILAAQFECYLRIIHEPQRTEEGPFCNRTWDGWLCWGDTAPGTSMQMCPEYFQDFDPSEKVSKVCNPDGQWFHHPESNRVWSNYTQCQAYTEEKLKFAYSLYYLAFVGHGLSVISLIISLVIFSYFKSLSCQRISLHKNMFLSFIFNSICTVIWLSAVANNQQLVTSNPIGCKIMSVLNQYTFGSNYFWMLCEGIYLHTLIIVAVFVGEQQLFWYYVLGWGFPIIPAITYAVARGLFFDDKCWISSDTYLLYIIHGPIHAALLVNLFFLLNIVRVLITKLKVTHNAESNAYMKVVRATLILIPLLGAQFILVPWRPEGRMIRAVYEFIMIIFSHFQGVLVAIMYCFCNAEVRTALRRKWTQFKSMWRHTPINSMDSHCNYRTNSSVTETSRATINLEQKGATQNNSFKKTDVMQLQANGQYSNGKQRTNGEADTTKILETTAI